MTDTPDMIPRDGTPERIWGCLTYCAGGQIICYPYKANPDEIGYIREDVADARVTAALREAAEAPGTGMDKVLAILAQAEQNKYLHSTNEMLCDLNKTQAEELAEARAEIKRLQTWQSAAFLAHPNIDLDIEGNPDALAAIQETPTDD
jgi:hypothetical protein